MGVWQCISKRFNERLGCTAIDELSDDLVETLGHVGPIDQFLKEAEICNDVEIEFLSGWPEGTKAVLRAAIRSAVHRERRAPMSFSWAPGYDFEVTVWESRSLGGFAGGMTVLIRTPYP